MPRAAMLLCAGLGTRLRPLTDELPKPLVPVGDRPLLAHTLARLAAAGIERAVVNTHHLPGAFGRDLEGFGVEVHLTHEPEIRGTAGGIAGARSQLGDAPVLVWNGDVLLEAPVEALLAAARRAPAALAVAPRPMGQGTLGIDAAGCVVRLRGERFGDEAAGGDFVGVSALEPALVAALPDRGCLVGDVWLPLLRRGEPLRAVPAPSEWYDVGEPAGYLAANLAWLAAKSSPEGWIGPGSSVAPDVRIRASIVGARARIVGAGPLERCVVWPAARATAPLSDAIVTSAGRVVQASTA